MAGVVKNSRNEFEKALGLDMVWLAAEMSRPEVGMMTEEEYEDIKSPRLLTEAQKRGAIVSALVRTLELDIDGENLTLFLQILGKKRQLFKKAIKMLKGEALNGMCVATVYHNMLKSKWSTLVNQSGYSSSS